MSTSSSNRWAGGITPKQQEENYHDVELAPLVTPSSQDHTEDSGTPSKPSAAATSLTPLNMFKSLTSGSSGKVLYACTLYSFCSVSMVLFNKSLASRYVIYFRVSVSEVHFISYKC
jgi:hypothetical protein